MGDVMFAELLETYRRGLATLLDRTDTDPFALVRPHLAGGDLNVVNLESVLSEKSVLGEPFSRILIAAPRTVDLLVGAGINVANTANNHALDHGEAAFARSCALLEERGIAVIGYAPGRWFQEEPVVRTVAGRRVGLLGYNIANFPAADRDGVMARAAAVVRAARPAVDVLLVSVHWGEEYTNVPPAYVVAYGRQLLAAGCDVLHGHHSHQVQGVHDDGSRVFAPSLGNFVFDQKVEANRITAILQVDVGPEGTAHAWMPCRMNDRYQPVPAPEHAAYLADLDAKLAEAVAGRGAAGRDQAITSRVQAGHRDNRIRMRLGMLAHFWDFLPHLAAIRAYRRSPTPMFSVIRSSADLPGSGR